MVKPDVCDLEASCSTRIQVTCNRVFPLNKLFEHWLIELGVEAYSKEKKSGLSYNRALCSLRLFPSELHSIEEAKTLLLHFGERICAELDKRLDMFRLQYGSPTLENVQGYIKSQSRNVGLPSLVNQNRKCSPVEQQVNEESTQRRELRSPESIKTESVKVGSGTVANKRRNQNCVPKYRSGGYAILRALYEFANSTSGEWLGTVELQKVAQQFCDEYIGPSTRNQPFTAWAARKTLINKNMIEMRRSKGNEYRLTSKGKSIAERFAKALGEQGCNNINSASHMTRLPVRHGLPGARYPKFCESGPSFFDNRLKQRSELAQADPSSDGKIPAPEDEPLSSRNFVIFENESGSIDELAKRHASTSELQALLCRECGCSHRVMESSKFHLTLLVDHSETKGGPVGRCGPVNQRQTSRAKMHCALAEAGIRFEERDLNLGDYLWVLQSRSDRSLEFVVDVIIERKRIDDLAKSIMGREARYREQKFRLKRCGIARIVYLVEGCDGFASMADYKKTAIRGACSRTRVIDNFDVVKTANVTQTVDYLQAMTDYIRSKLVLPIWVCGDTNGDGTFEEPKRACCRKLMHCMQRFHQFNSKSRKQRAWTVTETFARMLLQFNGISAERAQEIINLYPTAAHIIDVYRELEESSKTQASSETQQLSPLAVIQSGRCKRSIGKMSENIDHFFTSVKSFNS
ncbi:hypothetical protein M514_08652 [Trichuris suis]|uniref:Crossover junction endonuclease MUS81 n=1 Tax=Trichuris suis TaxID=68888 RepID=A0A085N3H5_9BILA|nr:hypothetical protein M513_08652 [Trichuris suis]KFD64021.1 hypothetical protein M514_08652 [Trichuris suis]